MSYGYDYTHGQPDGNGMEYISFKTEPPRVDANGLIEGVGVYILLDHPKQMSRVFRAWWRRGALGEIGHMLTLKDEILGEAEIPALMERLGIEVKEAHNERPL